MFVRLKGLRKPFMLSLSQFLLIMSIEVNASLLHLANPINAIENTTER